MTTTPVKVIRAESLDLAISAVQQVTTQGQTLITAQQKALADNAQATTAQGLATQAAFTELADDLRAGLLAGTPPLAVARPAKTDIFAEPLFAGVIDGQRGWQVGSGTATISAGTLTVTANVSGGAPFGLISPHVFRRGHSVF